MMSMHECFIMASVHRHFMALYNDVHTQTFCDIFTMTSMCRRHTNMYKNAYRVHRKTSQQTMGMRTCDRVNERVWQELGDWLALKNRWEVGGWPSKKVGAGRLRLLPHMLNVVCKCNSLMSIPL